MEKFYDPRQTEDKIYAFWEKTGFFNPDKLSKRHKKPYTIVIPPPNVTGNLHMGHALNATIQDILIRWKRMNGFKTLWLPGTDHAGIATQNVVEKKLKKEGKTRFDLGREKFIEEVWKWKEEKGNAILGQLKRMGASCDWSRTRFTMDNDYAQTVRKAFLHYYKKGLIYQGERVVNWCVRCQTSLSDLELEYEETDSHLYYINYPAGKKNITVATTRPETLLGDVAVAVNPKDKRYKSFVGQTAVLPLVGREIPIIGDRAVDAKFGTGAVKVTPAHDLADYEISQRHNLESIKVIDEYGKITAKAPKSYIGLKVKEVREKVLEDLKKQGYLEKTEDYIHKTPRCYRCNTTIELIPSKQWFLKMDKLARLAKKPVESGKIKFYPNNFKKPYLDWLNNTKDWCISRQIWWGHKIPLEGETDVLDTWFSSALWPLATMTGKDKKVFYPTDTLSTARDIINLWVSRMIFSGLEFEKKVPFQDVYIHATILTKDGQRMSKSLGTGIDPLDLIDRYGSDAVRFGIAYQVMGNQDLKFTEDNIVMGKKFCNKVWNASRFVIGRIKKGVVPAAGPKTAADKKILSRLKKTIKSVNGDLEKFRFGPAAHTLYDFFWHDFCDQYLEESKKQEDENTDKILVHVLLSSLKMLHPFIPFITEEIYSSLPTKKKEKALIIEKWPSVGR